MTHLRPFRVLAPLLVFLFSGVASAGSQDIKAFTLYGGSNVDSTEQASPWIPVRGANRIVMRFWSAKAAFHASTDADSIYSDSIATFRVAFSDSMQLTNPLVAGDSVVYTAAFVDTLFKYVGATSAVGKALRGPSNGSGAMVVVFPTTPLSVAPDNNGNIMSQYMRVYVTPLRRMTVTGSQSTAGKRVNGLKGLRGRAMVIYDNK